jgi:hypothetical protein
VFHDDVPSPSSQLDTRASEVEEKWAATHVVTAVDRIGSALWADTASFRI